MSAVPYEHRLIFNMAARRTCFGSLSCFRLLRPLNGSIHQRMVFEKLELARLLVRPQYVRHLWNTSVVNKVDILTQPQLPKESKSKRSEFKVKSYQIRKLCEDGKFTEAMALLESLLEKYASTTTVLTTVFNCILHYTIKNNHSALVELQLSKMTQYNINRNASTYYNIVLYYSQLGMLDKGIEILKGMKAEGLKTTPRNYYPLIRLAASTGRLETLFKLYDELKEEHYMCHEFDSVVIEGVMNSNEGQKWRTKVLEMFHNMRANRIMLSQDTSQTLKDWFESQHEEKWVVNWSTVHSSGVCQSCMYILESGSLSKSEHEVLKQHFVNYLWQNHKGRKVKSYTSIGIFEDQYCPEIDHKLPFSLEKYIHETGPYDIVLDALNVAHCGNRREFRSKQVEETARHFLNEGKRVLVVGTPPIPLPKTRQSSSEEGNTNSIFKNCGFFLLSGRVQDDIFILLAAIHCGLNTLLVSNDLFQDHMNKLPLSAQTLLGRWLRSNQILLTIRKGDTFGFKRHPCHDPIVQMTANTWHLPLDDNVNWLCVNKQN